MGDRGLHGPQDWKDELVLRVDVGSCAFKLDTHTAVVKSIKDGQIQVVGQRLEDVVGDDL